MARIALACGARSRRGNAAYTVVSVFALLGFAALAVDIGHVRMVQAELHAATDAGSLAGVQGLDGTEAGLVRARELAVQFTFANLADRRSVVVDPTADVTLGTWDDAGGTFTASDDPLLVDAVRVVAHRDDVDTVFGLAAFGVTTLAAGAQSIAIKPETEPAGAVTCYLPFAIPSCMLEVYAEEQLAFVDLAVNTPGVDNVGWARLDGSPNADYARDVINECRSSGEVQEGDPLGLANGVMTSAMTALTDALEGSDTTWDVDAMQSPLPTQMDGSSVAPGSYGNTFEGAIMIFESGPEYCESSGGSFTGYQPLLGFAWGVVYDVKSHGPAAERTVKLRLDLTREHVAGTGGNGGIDLGVEYQPPERYVR